MSEKNVEFYGKIAKFPKNTKAKKAWNFLENIKIPKNKLWYFIIERELVTGGDDLQIIKYNNMEGIDCTKFIESLKSHYKSNVELYPHIENLVVEGNDKFSTIKNIPNVTIGEKTLISILAEDLIKILYK